jgi:hypothetical protein
LQWCSILCCQVFYLVDDVLILALGLEVEGESPDGSNDATDAFLLFFSFCALLFY